MTLKQKFLPQGKRLAMGDSLAGYKSGGKVGIDVAKPVNVVVNSKTGKSASPITMARRNNGIPGMKKGGKG